VGPDDDQRTGSSTPETEGRRPLRAAGKAVLFLPRLLLRIATAGFAALLLFVTAIAAVQMLWVSPRDVAYRFATPGVQGGACERQARDPGLLAAWANSEDDTRAGLKYDPGLECMLQHHTLPHAADAAWNGGAKMGDIGYYLSFLEFQENGRPVQKGLDGTPLKRAQLDVLEEHLSKQEKNYVIVFVHGWRRDARIGDDNVANARVFAAHAASFLDYRCKATGSYCGYTVTMVYVGWRGARVDERAVEASIRRKLAFLGGKIDNALIAVTGKFPALLTLFDRKPVSERIAPSVVSSLRHVDRLLRKGGGANRLLVIGHSLGGNMLASGLNRPLIELIRNHRPGEIATPPLGDLIVLLNPAAEAWKWTSLQRETALHTTLPENASDTDDGARKSLSFWNPAQRPLVVSVTSAFSWPAADLTDAELRERGGRDPDSDERRALAKYDFATHDFFPMFKGNLLPASESLDRLANWFPGSTPKGGTPLSEQSICKPLGYFGPACSRAVVRTLRVGGAVARNLPFMNSVAEETVTIGHMDPPRPPFDSFDSSAWRSPLPFGTTHELIVNNSVGHPTRYTNAASPYLSECANVDHWLWKARHNETLKPYEGWDSGYSHVRRDGSVVNDASTPNLTPVRPRPVARDGHLEVQLRQFLYKSGTQPIITSNDPFWNVRAFDTTLAFHGGYVTYPFVCFLNQLVLDDIASEPAR
jgi:hypothetical protein